MIDNDFTSALEAAASQRQRDLKATQRAEQAEKAVETMVRNEKVLRAEIDRLRGELKDIADDGRNCEAYCCRQAARALRPRR